MTTSFYIALALTILGLLSFLYAVRTQDDGFFSLSALLGMIAFPMWIAILLNWYTIYHRRQVTKTFKPAIEFKEAQSQLLPKATSWAKKRGFGDFNGDGIEDMIEIRDEVWIGQEFHGYIFHGRKDENGKLAFAEEAREVVFPNKLKWWTSQTKLDVGDINGDGFCDVIFSQYNARMQRDDLHFAFAINNHKEKFLLVNAQMRYAERSTFSEILLKAVDRMSTDEDEGIDDWLKMDWADINGDGSDDFVMMWWNSELEVIYTEKTPIDQKAVIFKEEGYFKVKGFLIHRNIREFDTEDFDGDGKDDLLIQEGHKNLWLSVALNRGDHFEKHKDFHTSIPSVSYFNFRKFDTFDVNFDNCADFIKIGRVWGKSTMFYKEVIPQK